MLVKIELPSTRPLIGMADVRRARMVLRARAALSRPDEPKAAEHPNDAQAAHAFLRAARLNAVANGVAGKLAAETAKLEAAVVKEMDDHTLTPDSDLSPLFQQFKILVTAAFERMARIAEDDFTKLHGVIVAQGAKALSAHLGVTSDASAGGDVETLVMGAPLADHFEKLAADALFRLKAAVRTGVAVGDDAKELKARVTGMTVKARSHEHGDHIHAAAPPADIVLRLFDATDNSVLKVVKAAVTAFAQAADDAVQEGVPDDEPRNMGFIFTSAQDGSVCPTCEFYDGNFYDENKDPVGDSPELESEPPLHFSCRCALISCDLDGEKPDGNFASYLDQFSDQEQRQAFGDANVENYRKGDLTPSGLMGQTTHGLSLEQFKSGEPELRFDLDKYTRMGEQSAEDANERTAERRAAQ
jgi:hypothetical protein